MWNNLSCTCIVGLLACLAAIVSLVFVCRRCTCIASIPSTPSRCRVVCVCVCFVCSISPDVLSHRDELSALAGDEVTRIITEQRVLERRYEELITARSQLKGGPGFASRSRAPPPSSPPVPPPPAGLSNKTRYKEIQTEIQHLNHALRESTKTLCRSLKENPDVGENLLKISLERERLLELFSKVGDELESGRFDSLVAHVQMEKESRMRMEEIVEREKTSAAKVAELTTALEQEKAARAREVGEKTAAIRAVKEELQKLKVSRPRVVLSPVASRACVRGAYVSIFLFVSFLGWAVPSA